MSKPLRVLIVEDSEDDALLVERELKHAGFEVVSKRVETAESMRSALETQPWDFVISDYSLPSFNAPAALAALQATGLDLPFIIVSGTVGEDVAVEGMRSGAQDFILKGNLTRLAPAVQRELEQAAHRKARRMAEESNQRLLRAVEAAGNAIFMTDPSGTMTYVNPAFEEIYSYSRQEALGKTPRILKSGQHDQAFYELFWQRLLAGESVREEFVNKTRDGRLVTVETSVSPVLDAQGRRIGFIAVQDDVTERKRAEKALRESEERYRNIVEHARALIYTHDLEGKLLSINRVASALLGYDVTALAGHNLRNLLAPRFQAELDTYLGRIRAEGVASGLMTLTARDGSTRTLEYRNAVHAEAGQETVVHGIALDVTERLEAERALLRSEKLLQRNAERFRSLIENAQDIITVIDLQGGILFQSPASQRLLGRLPEEFVGRNAFEFVHSEDAAGVQEALRRSVENPEFPQTALFRFRHVDGSWRMLEGVGKLLIGEDPPQLVVNSRDVTARRQLEEQLRQSQRMEAVGQLAGGIAHDFNNLLTAILGYGSLLASRFAPDAPGREEVDEILRASERAAALTQQLLAFSRKQVLEPVVLEVNELVRDLEKMLRRLIGEDLELATRLDPSAGKVRADPGQLEQVIVNLVVNARDAMPRGGRLTIETADADLDEAYAQSHASVRPGRYVMVAVSDTGVGMDAATQARIFEPFFTTKEKGKGTGLGLSTAYGIVKQSGGYIWVYSEPEKGTTFKVYLPRVEETVAQGLTRPADSLPTAGTETVLVVEDEPSIRTLAKRVLEARGYRVLEASSGKDALERVGGEEGPIHLLLTDLVMPDMGGTELASRLQDKHPTLRVLFMSGYTDDGVVRNGLLGPGRAFLQKPFTPAILLRKIRDVLA